MKLGIYGGTFSPVHNGHISAARQFRDEIGLDKLLIIPAKIPPHKSAEGIVDAMERFHLCELAFENEEKTEICDMEIKREGTSFTYYTIKELRDSGYDDIYLLVGTDMMMYFDKWHRWEEILSMCTLVLALRAVPSESDLEQIKAKINGFRSENGAKIIELDISPVDVSSTEVRERLKAHRDVSGLIPEKEYGYIIKKGLYND